MRDLVTVKAGLFIPATEMRFILKAIERKEEAVVIDLEDSIAETRKGEAREMLPVAVAALAAAEIFTLVRINADESYLSLDIDAAIKSGVDCIIVPKCVNVASVQCLESILMDSEIRHKREVGSTKLIALLESAMGVVSAYDICVGTPRIAGVLFGTEDFCASLGISSVSAALEWPAQQVAIAARAAGIAAFGLPGSILGLEGETAFFTLAVRARSMGFTGCFCIHPKQVDAARQAFVPSNEEIESARRIVGASEAEENAGKGAYVVDGRMIDAPVLAQARLVMKRASQLQ